MKQLNINPFVVDAVATVHKRYPITKHPLIVGVTELSYPVEGVHYIAKNIYYVVKHFPRFLSAITANMEDHTDRLPLIENLFEEHGRMNPDHIHLNSYLDFLQQIGVSREELKDFVPCSGAIAYVRSILDLCLHYPYREGLAALGVVEDIVHRVSPLIGEAAKSNVRDLQHVAHFAVHEVLDEQHAAEIYALLRYSNNQEKECIERGLMLGGYYHYQLYSSIIDEMEQGQLAANRGGDDVLGDTAKLQSPGAVYPLNASEAGIKRLTIANKVYNMGSVSAIIAQLYNGERKRVLEVGCGVGILAEEVASFHLDSHSVLATDINPVYIDKAKERVGDRCKNLTFSVWDVNKIESLPEKFDVIYIRWVLIYMPNIAEIVAALYDKLNPKGVLIVEDNNPANPGCYSPDMSDLVEQWNRFFGVAFVKGGQSSHVETVVVDALSELGAVVRKSTHQGILTSSEEKSLFYLGILEARAAILRMGVSEAMVDGFIEKLKTLQKSKYAINFVNNFQVFAEKPC